MRYYNISPDMPLLEKAVSHQKEEKL